VNLSHKLDDLELSWVHTRIVAVVVEDGKQMSTGRVRNGPGLFYPLVAASPADRSFGGGWNETTTPDVGGCKTADSGGQRKRWAAFHGKHETPVAPKREIPLERKAVLVANLQKARAARAAKRSAGGKVPF
jgi:hypothetical protein